MGVLSSGCLRLAASGVPSVMNNHPFTYILTLIYTHSSIFWTSSEQALGAAQSLLRGSLREGVRRIQSMQTLFQIKCEPLGV